MVPGKGKARLITQAGPEGGDDSAQGLGGRRGGILEELGAALVLLLRGDRLHGAGEGVQGAQEATVRLVRMVENMPGSGRGSRYDRAGVAGQSRGTVAGGESGMSLGACQDLFHGVDRRQATYGGLVAPPRLPLSMMGRIRSRATSRRGSGFPRKPTGSEPRAFSPRAGFGPDRYLPVGPLIATLITYFRIPATDTRVIVPFGCARIPWFGEAETCAVQRPARSLRVAPDPSSASSFPQVSSL